ncbi:hypothetical protein [Pedobacter psychrodurus]|uniref:hypothetical protein n=1 Tax=Pedobacter psychrodurus TaxID=2530456 RepID=UPI0029309B9C|nr:hypothetical protein [Pedobacter psychrodurus]
MTIFEKIEKHQIEKNYVKIKRDVGNKSYVISRGYILTHSFDFVLIVEDNNFVFDGYRIFPIASITKIRHNEFDQFYDSIMEQEGHKKLIELPYQIDLESWESIFDSIKNINLKCAVENENNDRFFFKIGELVKVKRRSLKILNFDPAGYIDDEPTKIKYKEISSVSFDDNYTNTMSKYLRIRE